MPKCSCCVKRPRCEIAQLAEVEENVTLGADLIALRNAFATSDRSFGRLARRAYNISPTMASQLVTVARRYGNQRSITDRLSWSALVELSAPSLPDDVRRELERRILDGERISAADISRACWSRPIARRQPLSAGFFGQVAFF